MTSQESGDQSLENESFFLLRTPNSELQTIQHTPVFLSEVISFLNPRSGGVYVDATLGAGGHSEKILELSVPDGFVIGLDLDPSMILIAEKRLERFKGRFLFFENNFTEIPEVLKKAGHKKTDGIIFDLGVSMFHFRDSRKGFSFMKEGPLDMRLSSKMKFSAEDVVNKFNERELADIFFKYGEERNARRIARYIVSERKSERIKTTTQLSNIVCRASGGRHVGGIHPATRVFQALRIAVNGELGNIEKALPLAIDLLAEGARICVISFHSLEDRIVKNVFRNLSKEGPNGEGPKVKIVTKKPLMPGREEIISNPSARSAKLRVAEKI